MTHTFIWTQEKVDEFIYTAMLEGEDAEIFKEWVQKCSRVEMALKHNCSIATIDRRIRHFKDQYKEAAMYNPML